MLPQVAAAKEADRAPHRPTPHPAPAPCAQEHLQELSFTFEDVCCRGDRVAVYRSASVVAKDGTRQPGIAVFDVWRVVGGQVRPASGTGQCFNWKGMVHPLPVLAD